jgi:type IV secretion system protein VirB3
MSDASRESLAVDPVYLGMTRPPMIWGVPFRSFVLNGVVTTIAFLAWNDLRGFLLFLPVHALSYLLCLRDPRIFDLLFVRAATTPPVPNASFWKAKSYTP